MPLDRLAIGISLIVLQSACAGVNVPLGTPPGSDVMAGQHNSQGLAEYKNEEWGMARYHFGTAIAIDPKFAEAHFNLGLALHMLDLHTEATKHFKKAGELDPTNDAITQSKAYRKHTDPSASFYSHDSPADKAGNRRGSLTNEQYFEIYRTP